MSPTIPCPQGEEFSAILDWELSPERLPALERHIEECPKCRAYYLRLAAADRMLGLSLGEVKMLAECLALEPGAKDASGDKLVQDLKNFGREEWLAALHRIAREKAARRKRLLIKGIVALVLIAGGFVAALQTSSPVKSISGGLRREAGYVTADGAGEVLLCNGTRVKLEPGATAAFRATWRWEDPQAELVRGKLSILEGTLSVQVGAHTKFVGPGNSVEAPDGKAP